jgi:hypothetical protein
MRVSWRCEGTHVDSNTVLSPLGGGASTHLQQSAFARVVGQTGYA